MITYKITRMIKTHMHKENEYQFDHIQDPYIWWFDQGTFRYGMVVEKRDMVRIAKTLRDTIDSMNPDEYMFRIYTFYSDDGYARFIIYKVGAEIRHIDEDKKCAMEVDNVREFLMNLKNTAIRFLETIDSST